MIRVRVIDKSGAAMQQIEAAATKRFRVFADEFVEIAKERSPRLSGNNASTIRALRKGPLKWWVHTESNYGAYLELGTSRMAPRPYFAPAYRAAAKNFERNRGKAWE